MGGPCDVPTRCAPRRGTRLRIRVTIDDRELVRLGADFGLHSCANVEDWEVPLGLLTSLSGSAGILGRSTVNCAQLAVDEINADGGMLGRDVRLVVVVMPDGVVPSLQRPAGRRRQPTLLPADAEPSGAPPHDGAIFEAIDVHKSFGFFRLIDGLTLRMDEPELRCLIGPNGAGKSTLLDILCGQQGCQAGTVRVFGQECTGEPSWEFARNGVSRKFQSPQLIDDLSVATNVAIAAWGADSSPWGLVRRSWNAPIPPAASEILERTGLGERLGARAGDLSHGDKQWLEVAMALAGNCRLLLLDEPTAGMTVAESLEAAALLRDLHARHGLPIVIVEHDMTFIRAVADRVTVLARGAVLADGDVAEVEANPHVRAIYSGVDT